MIEEELQLLRALRERTGGPSPERKLRSKKKTEKESSKEKENFGQEKDLEVSENGFEKQFDQRVSFERDILAEPTVPLEDNGQPEMTSSCKPENIWKEEPELEHEQTRPLSQESYDVCGLSEPIHDLLTPSNESVCSAKDEE